MERNANAVAAGRVAGIDPVEEVKKRCVRIVGASEPEVGGCVLCRLHCHLFSSVRNSVFACESLL